MESLLANMYFIIPAFGLSVFFVAYFLSDKIISYCRRRVNQTSEEILTFMEKIQIDVEKKKIKLLTLLLSFGVGFLFFLVFFPNIILGLLFGGIMTLVGWSLPKIVMKSIFEKRCNIIVDNLVDGLTIMGNGIKSGLSVPQSIERVVLNMKGPLAQEFNLLLSKTRLGMSLEEALNEFSDRIPRQNVQMLVMAINILKETGGNLAETFATIVTTIRERQKIEKKIQAMTAQGLTQGIIITLVPFFLIVVFLIIDPGYIKPLFTQPLGWVALMIMLGLQVIGGVIMKKVVTIKV